MRRKKKVPYGWIMLIAAAAVIVLILLGTRHIMQTDNMSFAEAFAAFMGRVFGTK